METLAGKMLTKRGVVVLRVRRYMTLPSGGSYTSVLYKEIEPWELAMVGVGV